MKTKVKFLLFGTFLALSACGKDSSMSSFAQAKDSNRLKIKAELAAKPEGENSVWSAASLDGLLALIGRGYAPQQRQLVEEYLGQSLDQATAQGASFDVEGDGITVKSANNVWVQEDFKLKPSFVSALEKAYNGLKPQTMDVSKPKQVAKEVNQWIEKRTNDMLKDVIKPEMITSDLVSLLANALYFKGEWLNKFDKKLTKNSVFTTVNKATNKQKVEKVATMQQPKTSLQVLKQADLDGSEVTSIRLPYKGEKHAMYIVFSSKKEDKAGVQITTVNTKTSVQKVYENYIANDAAFSNAYYPGEVDLFTLPKFTIESEIKDIQDNLAKAGYESLFKSGVLSEMTSDTRLALSFILQKAKIVVNEEGSEAAAVSVGGVRSTAIQIPKHVLVNGPFAYAIRDEASKVTLFEGVVRSPK